jgi:trk system potassium uptake protein TrkA
LNYVELAPGFSVQEMAVPNRWVGKSLRELALPRKHGISVVAVHDVLLDRVQAVPDPDAMLKESDTLLVAGADTSLAKAARLT